MGRHCGAAPGGSWPEPAVNWSSQYAWTGSSTRVSGGTPRCLTLSHSDLGVGSFH